MRSIPAVHAWATLHGAITTITFAFWTRLARTARAYASTRGLRLRGPTTFGVLFGWPGEPQHALFSPVGSVSACMSLSCSPSSLLSSSAFSSSFPSGVFDLMHYGHSNALRQARACGDVLVVGLVADDEVERNKGSRPVMPEEERALALEGCKFVDEVIRGVPYDLSEEWVNKLVAEHNIDYIVHGDDPCITADGKDAYAYAKAIGRYKQIKRTEGVSTTDIVGRMLLMTREHHVRHDTPSGTDGSASAPSATSGGAGTGGKPVTTASLERSVRSSSLGSLASLEEDAAANAASEGAAAGSSGAGAGAGESASASAGDKPAPPSPASSLPSVQSKFLPTARRIMQFADGKAPKPDDVVVYMAGSFDMFNAGHIAALREARKFGTFLIVGVHDDPTVHALRGQGLPILNLYERTLSLLSCKYVDEVIIGAPWDISEDLIKTMNIKVVVRGDCSDMQNGPGHEALGWEYDAASMEAALAREYAVPLARGILQTFHSPMPLTAVSIVHRIMQVSVSCES